MDALNPRKLNRSELAKFLPTHELIKAFEALFALAAVTPDEVNTLTALIEEVTASAETATSAHQAIASQLARMASALETLSLAPAVEPPRIPDEVLVCPSCSALREELTALSRRVSDLESR